MDRLSEAFRVLGDPTRLRIVRLVAEAPLNVSEIVSLVGVAQPSVSHHLAKLKSAGLIAEDRQGGFAWHSLAVTEADPLWPLVRLAREAVDALGDVSRLRELLRSREDRASLNEKLLEPGQSWALWARALGTLMPPMHVADFGCGTGVLTVELARWARKVTAIDRAGVALAKAQARVEREGLTNVTFLEADLHALPLPAGKHDLVVVSQSLHHVADPDAVLREAARIVKAKGRIVVLELAPHGEAWVRERLGHQHLGLDPQALKRSLLDAGFRDLHLVPFARDGAAPFKPFLVTGARS